MAKIECPLSGIIYQSSIRDMEAFRVLECLRGIDRYKFLARRKAFGTPMISLDNPDTFYYPMLDGIIVHLNKDQTRYNTALEAQEVANIIKQFMIAIIE